MNKIGKKLLLAAMTLATITNLAAQELKMPTLEDLISGGSTYRYTENLYGLQWWGDRCIKPSIDSLFSIDPRNKRCSSPASR